MSEALTLPAPGKLNLFLHVLGRRGDGYHLLQTLFQLVDLCDELRFEPLDAATIELAGDLSGIPDEENLIHRAARLLAEHVGTSRGARIALAKRLPLGGGMGGGSSDAATTLVGLNRLWATGLAQSELEALALRIGADVPLFVRGRSAWGEGVGEELAPVELPPRWYLVVAPAGAISTAEVFASPRLTRDTAPITMADFFAGGRDRNDCEAVVRELSSEVDEALLWLSQWGPARMTGTGCCVFLPLEDRHAAEQIQSEMPDHWRSFVTRGINVSPLYR